MKIKKFNVLFTAPLCDSTVFVGGSDDKDNNINNIIRHSVDLYSLNIRNAKTIFKKASGNTKSSSNYVFWKIDKDGREEKLVLSDKNRNESDVTVNRLIKLSDDLLLMAVSESYTSIEMTIDTVTPEYSTHMERMFFVNTETERIFEFQGCNGNEIYEYVSHVLYNPEYTTPCQDKNGIIYFNSYYGSDEQIIKLDTHNFTLSTEMPENQGSLGNFKVSKDGFILYGEGNKIKCPDGRIYPTDGVHFILNGDLYTFEDRSIYLLKVIDNNTLEQEFICSFYDIENDIEFNVYNYIENHVKKCAVFESYNGFFEFDGKNCPIKIAINNYEFGLNSYYLFNPSAITKEAFYIYQENNNLFKIDLLTYQLERILTSDFEINDIVSDIKSEGFSFSGISHLNSTNIIGTVNSSGKINTEFTFDNDDNEIVNLIEIY